MTLRRKIAMAGAGRVPVAPLAAARAASAQERGRPR